MISFIHMTKRKKISDPTFIWWTGNETHHHQPHPHPTTAFIQTKVEGIMKDEHPFPNSSTKCFKNYAYPLYFFLKINGRSETLSFVPGRYNKKKIKELCLNGRIPRLAKWGKNNDTNLIIQSRDSLARFSNLVKSNSYHHHWSSLSPPSSSSYEWGHTHINAAFSRNSCSPRWTYHCSSPSRILQS